MTSMRMATGTALAVVLAAPAAAQQTVASPEQQAQVQNASAAAADASPGTTSGIEDIVVTAQRRSEDQQKVPAAITAIRGADLEGEGRSQLDQVLERVPATQIDTGPRGFLVRIRGVGLDLPPTVGDPTVSVSRDDIVDDRTETTKAGFYDLDRVEVLRGPQGTLYGRNATGGAVNIITKNPIIGRYEGYALGEIGDFSLRHVEGAINVPLSDQFAARVAGALLDRDGYLSNGSNDNKAKAVRGKLLWQPSNGLTVLAGAEYTKIDGKGSSSVPSFGLKQPNDPYDNTTPFVRGNVDVPGPPAPGPPDPPDFTGYGPGKLDGENQKYYGRIDADVGIGTLTLLPGLQIYREDYKYVFAGAASFNDYTHTKVFERQASGEARLTSKPSSSITWVIGSFYYNNRNTEKPLEIAPGDAAYYLYRRNVETYAFFGQTTVPITDTLRLTGGLRWTHDHKTYVSVDNSTSAPAPLNCFAATPCFGEGKWSNLDYRAGVEFDVSQHSLLYGSVATGFSSGGYNFSEDATFKPQKLTAFEAGSKNRFWNNRVQVNLSAFYYDYRNYQASEQVLSPPGSNPPFYLRVSTAQARSYGGELETGLALTNHTRFSIAAAYLNAKFKRFDGVSNQVYNGRVLPRSPRWSLTGSADQDFKLTDTIKLRLHANTRYSTRYTLTYTDLPPFVDTNIRVQPSFWQTDAQIGLSFDDDRYSISAQVKNIEDYAVKTNIFGPFDVAVLGPRTFSVVGQVRFR